MNDEERSLWIDNDEGLYRWWKSSGLSKRKFIRENRDELTRVISRAINKPPQDPYPLATGEHFSAPFGGAPYPGQTRP